MEDTIVAISTPVGEGGIGIVRMSGKDSLKIADRIFKSKDNKKPSEFKTYTTHFGYVIARRPEGPTKQSIVEIASGASRPRNDSVVDEVILTVMRAPKSYTKENIVEINCHGGIIPLRKILELVVSLGARPAEPGEFTKRAFLNGRIDLIQAEAVLDIITAKTETSLKAAVSQLEGDLSKEVTKAREELLSLYSHIEASVDFPEENIEILSNCNMKGRLDDMGKKIKKLIDSADSGRVLREGVNAVICGKPNVGKSSLMNAFLKEKRVIVSPIPGTTRDTIEEVINIKGIPLKIIDTAGIINSKDLLTKEGVSRSRRSIEAADLALFLLDASEELSDEDLNLMDEIRSKKTIVVINKTDLPRKLDTKRINSELHDKKVIEISVEKKENLNKLEEAIIEMVWQGEISLDHEPLVTNVRHKNALLSGYEAIGSALDSLEKSMSPEFLAVNIKEAIDNLGRITGQTLSEDILDRIFSKFCIGK